MYLERNRLKALKVGTLYTTDMSTQSLELDYKICFLTLFIIIVGVLLFDFLATPPEEHFNQTIFKEMGKNEAMLIKIKKNYFSGSMEECRDFCIEKYEDNYVGYEYDRSLIFWNICGCKLEHNIYSQLPKP